MMFKAFVKDKETGESKFLESEYPSKADFINDLKHNGFSVSRAEPKDLYDFVLKETNGDEYDWEVAKKLYKAKKPLTREEYTKMKNGDDNDYEVVNDKSIDAIKDNFTPPGAKDKVDMTIYKEDEDRFGKDALKGLTGPRESEQLKDDIDTNDNGEIEKDEMADFQKSLDDYASKNKKGRDDIPVTTRR